MIYFTSQMVQRNWVSGSLIGQTQNSVILTASWWLLCFVSSWKQEHVNSRKWQTLIKPNEWQPAQVCAPQSALIQLGKAGSQLWFESRGRKAFYLKSGKPQEVTLRSFCHCVPANRQTIHRPTRMCGGACGETHNPTNTARLHMDGRLWWVIYMARVVITQADTHAEQPTFTNILHIQSFKTPRRVWTRSRNTAH